MSDLVLFQFETFQIRTITDEHGDPWFVLRDVLDAMRSTTKLADAVESVKQGLGDEGVADLPIPDALGRPQQTTIVFEAAVTYLVARSNTEMGRKLNKFIHTEVLPKIRKTGSYAPSLTPAQALLAQVQLMVEIERKQLALEAAQAETKALSIQTSERMDRIETAIDHYTIIGHARAFRNESLPLAEAAHRGKLASTYCKKHDIAMGEVPDPRFGTVKTYPKWVIEEVLSKLVN